MRYFVAGNFWLFVSLLLFVGKTYERSSPTRYSFLGVGHWFTPLGYNLLVALTFLIAVCFLIGAGRRPRP